MSTTEIPGKGLLYLPIAGLQVEPELPAPGSKRRRLRGACVECKVRKVRCDRAARPDNICSNCVAYNVPCTDSKEGKENASIRTPAEHVATILAQSTAYIASEHVRGILLEVAQYARTLEDEVNILRRSQKTETASRSSGASPSQLLSAEDPDLLEVLRDFRTMEIDPEGRERYLGKSSRGYLIQTAEELRDESQGRPGNVPVFRPQFWHSPWEASPRPLPAAYHFPSNGLLKDLITLYFNEIHILTPIIHRPSFTQDIAAGKHHTDKAFGGLVLAVCALAARSSSDPRVILPGTGSRLSSGWAFLEQIRYPDDPEFYFAMELYDIQRVVLTAMYLGGTGVPASGWHLVSLAIRNLQDRGRHRRPESAQVPATLTDELYKRVFWLLFVGDIFMSTFLGRPCCMREDDYDLDLPSDEYWDGDTASEQGLENPSTGPCTQHYISYLKLYRILGRALASLYSLDRSNRTLEASQTVAAQLDTQLEEWFASVPPYLQWDPQQPNNQLSRQSTHLRVTYYHVQIQIHRAFIPSPSNNVPLLPSSLATCLNAARGIAHVMDVQRKRGIMIGQPQMMMRLMDTAIMLLVNVWGAHRLGGTSDPARAVEDLRKCVECLRFYETYWQQAGRYCDQLLGMGQQLLENPPSPMSNPRKRPREAEEDRNQEWELTWTERLEATGLGHDVPSGWDVRDDALPYADFDYVFDLADSVLRMPVAPLPDFREY